MNLPDLLYEKRHGVARIAFHRPARLNALGDTTTRQLLQACEDAAADPEVRVLVITGEGDAFCAGGDFKDTFEGGSNKTAEQWSERIRLGPNQLVRVLQGMTKPVIASINGVAVGGGATIALACDFRIASERARFSFPFTRIGITTEFGCSYLLPRVVGLGRAMELLMLGHMIDADKAERIGLVNQVVPHEQLAQVTAELAAQLLEKPPRALADIKSLVHQGMTVDMERLLELEALTLGRAFTSEEHRVAVARFLSRKSDRAHGTSGH